MVPTDIKYKIELVIEECLRKANERFKVDLKKPTVLYNLSGKTAGIAYYRSWAIRINPILLMENIVSMIEETVPHEVAHLVTDFVFGENTKPHGREWKNVMRLFGVKPERCHNYDTSNAAVRKTRKFGYYCHCETPCKVGLNVHRKIQGGVKGYFCKRCKKLLAACEAKEIT